ncbi:hypothetical protein PR048_012302 [Dryococelus australis]|uniref:Uncharacterized protein n=1 Tax=Dryococelus australis TaxID=614101 RepID=A0ABQ9HNZ4_9NEOP|nr:hypothetical protein PR048_012302 [Dryococelus australis]
MEDCFKEWSREYSRLHTRLRKNEGNSRGRCQAKIARFRPPLPATQLSEPGLIPRGVAYGNRAGRCRLSVGFLGDLPFPLPFHSGTASSTLIGSQELDVKSRPNRFTHTPLCMSLFSLTNKSEGRATIVPPECCATITLVKPAPFPENNSAISLLDKIDFNRVYTEVTFAIRSEFIRHALTDSAPVADLQGPSTHWLSAVTVEGDDWASVFQVSNTVWTNG